MIGLVQAEAGCEGFVLNEEVGQMWGLVSVVASIFLKGAEY